MSRGQNEACTFRLHGLAGPDGGSVSTERSSGVYACNEVAEARPCTSHCGSSEYKAQALKVELTGAHKERPGVGVRISFVLIPHSNSERVRGTSTFSAVITERVCRTRGRSSGSLPRRRRGALRGGLSRPAQRRKKNPPPRATSALSTSYPTGNSAAAQGVSDGRYESAPILPTTNGSASSSNRRHARQSVGQRQGGTRV